MAATLAAHGEEIAAASPLGRVGRPDDMAGVAVYLSGRGAAYVTGAVIPVAAGSGPRAEQPARRGPGRGRGRGSGWGRKVRLWPRVQSCDRAGDGPRRARPRPPSTAPKVNNSTLRAGAYQPSIPATLVTQNANV